MKELSDLMDWLLSSNLGEWGTPPPSPLPMVEGHSSEPLASKHPEIHHMPRSWLLTIDPNLFIPLLVSSSQQYLDFFSR